MIHTVRATAPIRQGGRRNAGSVGHIQYGHVVDARENVRKEAVKAGVAEYVPGENGDPVFQWRKVVE